MATKRTTSEPSSKKAGAPAKRAGTDKADAKKVRASKGSGKKATSAHGSGSDEHENTRRDGAGAPRAAAQRRPKAAQVAAGAAQQLLELAGKEAEAVTGLERTEEGWRVQVEVVEVRRIPDTTDVLALYEIDVDEDGDIESYRRVRRYSRGAPGEG